MDDIEVWDGMPSGGDTQSPTIQITSPTSNPTYSTSTSTINIGGTASDNVGVTQVTWSNNRGGSGTATGTTSWSVNGITLQSGGNIITVTARDAASNTGTDTLNVTYTAPDTTPPGRSNGQPTGTLAAGTTQTTMSVTTNENATCRYSITAGVAYASMTNTFSTTGGTTHSTTITGLTNGQTYNRYVRCQDTAGNPNTDDYAITFSVANPVTCASQGFYCCPSDYTCSQTRAGTGCSGQCCASQTACTPPPACPDGTCNGAETCSTCPQDCLSGGQVCCSGMTYTGNCCSNSECTSLQTCTNHICTQPPTGQISVDTTYPGYSTSVIDDGIINSAGGTSTTWASSESTTQPHWIAVNFSSQTQVNYANIWWAYNSQQSRFMTSQRVDIQYWNGSSYVTTASLLYPGSDVPNSSSTFPAVTTVSLRFYQPANMGPPPYPTVLWITELDYGFCHRSDQNCNSCVEMPELNSFIDRWKVNNLDVTMPDMMGAIGLWKRGC